MKDYKLLYQGGVIRRKDGANIPPDVGNRDWRKYLVWLAEGNKPDPADPEPEPEPTMMERLEAVEAKVNTLEKA